MAFDKQNVSAAMSLKGFDQWQPARDLARLVRPRIRPGDLPGEGRQAAVMALLFPEFSDGRSGPAIVLTRRHEHLKKHAGQISLPGGRQDSGESLMKTALRETAEEIGIAPEKIEILGKLNQIYIPPTDFTVVPFVGWFEGRPRFVPSESEVAEIIEAPMKQLLQPETLVRGNVKMVDGSELEVSYYKIGPHRVWGATAIILSELIERLGRVV